MIKTHKALAELIAGKRVLHLNSLGKDSVLALEWLATYAMPSEIVSLHFCFAGGHPADGRYLDYLKRRYPFVSFMVLSNPIELSQMCYGTYQSPMKVMNTLNRLEHDAFMMDRVVAEKKIEYRCDFVCDGKSKYEDFGRRVKFHQKGLEFREVISPLGMMSRAEVIALIKGCRVNLHPVYKFSKSTLDHPTYWKMRSAFMASREYEDNVRSVFPLIALDKYRYERML